MLLMSQDGEKKKNHIQVPRGFTCGIWVAPCAASGWVFWKAPAKTIVSSCLHLPCQFTDD